MATAIHLLEAAEAVDAGEAIHVILGAYNDAKTGLSDDESLLALVLRDDSGAIIGGIYGRSYYSWLFIGLLVIPESLRGHNFGTKLMLQAEGVARARNCVGIWLDTFSFQAPGFYEKLGYSKFGEILDYPPGHARYFLKKHLV